MSFWVAGAAIVGSVGGALISGGASNSAANTQAQGATNSAQIAANAQLQAQKFQQQQEQPYQQAGQQALGQYQNLLNGGAANFNVANLPGYQFEMQQGQQALQNSAAARGGALSGNTIQATQQFGQGLASTQFQNYMSQLAGLANMGQSAASNVGNTGAQLLSGAGASLAGGVMGAANANAAGTVGVANAFNGAFNSPGVQKGLGSLFNSSVLGGDNAQTSLNYNNAIMGDPNSTVAQYGST
jgi:hypothetical protein